MTDLEHLLLAAAAEELEEERSGKEFTTTARIAYATELARTYPELSTEVRALRAANPDDIRAFGWAVAVHNDYRLNGVRNTFWLFTRGNRAVNGEGPTDAVALDQVRERLRALGASIETGTCVWHGRYRGEVTGCCLHAAIREDRDG